MAGYAALMRIDHAAPRLLAGGDRLPGPPDATVAPGPAWPSPATGEVIEDLGGTPFGGRLAETWADIREVWGQAMNVLRDPQGWR
jgi:hypothetical protein